MLNCYNQKLRKHRRKIKQFYELNAATLLANLMSKVKAKSNLNIKHITYWTDSTIVLSWLKSSNKRLKVYVVKRVAKIQTLSDINDWSYVNSSDTPADCAFVVYFQKNLIIIHSTKVLAHIGLNSVPILVPHFYMKQISQNHLNMLQMKMFLLTLPFAQTK